MPLSISVVIPTFNRVGRLEGALESVASQSLTPVEVLVVDDGSNDGTREMVAERFPDVLLLAQPRRGVSSARNRGIRNARGEWIAFLDSDDLWFEEKLEAQAAALEVEPGPRLVHTDEIWIRDGVRVNPGHRHRKAGGRIFRECLRLCAISPSSALVHRSVFDDIGLFDESLPACEDYDLWLRLAARESVLLVDRPLVIKHGGHRDQLSRTVAALDRYRIRSIAKVLDEVELDVEDREAAVAVLSEKIGIYRKGALRRGRFEEVAALDALAARFEAVAPGPGLAAQR